MKKDKPFVWEHFILYAFMPEAQGKTWRNWSSGNHDASALNPQQAAVTRQSIELNSQW